MTLILETPNPPPPAKKKKKKNDVEKDFDTASCMRRHLPTQCDTEYQIVMSHWEVVSTNSQRQSQEQGPVMYKHRGLGPEDI